MSAHFRLIAVRRFFERAPRGLLLFDLKDAKVIQDGALSIKFDRILFSKAARTFVQLIWSAAFFRAYNVWIAFVGFITFVVNLYDIWVHFYVCGQYVLYYIWVRYYICGQFLLHLYLQHSPPPLPSTFLVSTSIRGTGLLEEMQEHKLQTKHRNFKTWKSNFEQEK